jgi:hypothetical protein
MVIVDQDEGGGSGAEVSSVAVRPVLVNVRPPARLIERATASVPDVLSSRGPSPPTTHRWHSLTRSQPMEVEITNSRGPSYFGRPRPSQARASSVTYVEWGDHLVVLGVRDVSEPVLAVGPAGEPDGCLAAINATWQPCSAWQSPLRRTCPRRCWSARFMAASTASWSRASVEQPSRGGETRCASPALSTATSAASTPGDRNPPRRSAAGRQ